MKASIQDALVRFRTKRTGVLDAQAVYLKVGRILGAGGGMPTGKAEVFVKALHAAELVTRIAVAVSWRWTLTAFCALHQVSNAAAKPWKATAA